MPNGDGLCVSHYVAKYGRPPVDVGWPLPGSELLSKVMAALAESNAARHIFCPSTNYIEYDNGKQFEDPVKYVLTQRMLKLIQVDSSPPRHRRDASFVARRCPCHTGPAPEGGLAHAEDERAV